MVLEFSRSCRVFFIDRNNNLHPFITIANQGPTSDHLVRARISGAILYMGSRSRVPYMLLVLKIVKALLVNFDFVSTVYGGNLVLKMYIDLLFNLCYLNKIN